MQGMRIEVVRVENAIGAAQLFGTWPLAAREQLAAHAQAFCFQSGEVILTQAEPVDAVYVVMKGLVEVSFTSADGRCHIRRYAVPNTLFGLLPLFDDQASPYSYIAQQCTSILSIKKRALFGILEIRPELWQSVVRYFASFQRRSIADIEANLFETVPARLAQALLSLQPSGNASSRDAISIPITQEELAKLLGVSRQTISKELRRLEDADIVELEYKRITLLSPSALKRLLC